jgi:hypothetical protein
VHHWFKRRSTRERKPVIRDDDDDDDDDKHTYNASKKQIFLRLGFDLTISGSRVLNTNPFKAKSRVIVTC